MARPRKQAEHGTMARYRQHLADNEPPCQSCKTARADYERDRAAAAGARTGERGRPVSAPCGTIEAYNRHVRRCEPKDEACKAANARRSAERRAARKQAG